MWSEVPKPNRQEDAVFHARVGDTSYDLGPGTTGSLVWCGDAAYFVRDPQADTDPARLMRFSPDGTLTVVYESASQGNAFLSVPRCGGDAEVVFPRSLSCEACGYRALWSPEPVAATIPRDEDGRIWLLRRA